MKKNIIVTGATGFIGQKLTNKLLELNYNVTIFSRNTKKAKLLLPNAFDYVEWNYLAPELWKNKINNADTIIHLSGTNLFEKRWDNNFKKQILESRQTSTRNLVSAIKHSNNKPKVFISSSAIGIYGDRGNNILFENSQPGVDFLSRVCKVWESEAQIVENYGVRSVRVRTGLVLSSKEGALKQMLVPFKFFVGGSLGNGKQWLSWIHINDIINIYLKAIGDDKVTGSINAVSPNPVTMSEFATTLGKVLKRPSLFKVPKFILKIAIGEAANIITASQKVSPNKLLDLGYHFEFSNLEDALRNLIS